MQNALEQVARDRLAQLVDDVEPERIDLDTDMVNGYGLTSLNKVLFLTAVCDDAGVGLSHFTEHDLAAMRTLRDVVEALARHSEQVAQA
jgi:acyl carrier protein